MTLFDSDPPPAPDVGSRVESKKVKARRPKARPQKPPAVDSLTGELQTGESQTVDSHTGASPGVEAGSPPESLLTLDPSTAVRLRLVLSYDGAGFRGFAAQQGQRTVAGELASAIATVARHPVEITCAGRTDAGVHALGQVIHVDVRPEVDPNRLAKAVNAMLGPAVVVHSVAVAAAGFDARHSARARSYRYLVLESATPDPLLAATSWHVRGPLDLRAMAAGADALLGEHDFRAFCRRAPGTSPDDPIVRRVIDARFVAVTSPFGLRAGGRLLAFDITASSFCHQMVRSITGALVDVGRLRWRAADINRLLSAGVRPSGTTIAPAHGLCLTAVDYGPDDADEPGGIGDSEGEGSKRR